MPSRNLVLSDAMQFPNGAMVAGGGGEIHHPWPWFPDERDGFISWLKAEFAASNAIIDSLCHHLRSVGDPGEYDLVIGCVQQRRVAWNPVLHMQQFYPITDIMGALQQVAWRRQPRVVDQGRAGVKEFKRSGVHSFGSRHGQWAEATKGIDNSIINVPHLGAIASVPVSKEKKETTSEREEAKLEHDFMKSDLLGAQKVTDASLKSQMDSSFKTSKNRDETDYPCTESASEEVKDGKTSNTKESRNLIVGKNDDAIQNQKEESLIISPKTFYAMETNDGKTVNVAEGLTLYEELLGGEEVSELVSLVNDLRASGIRGQLLGPTFLVSKRPFRGHGREIIQLGDVVSDAASDLKCVFGRVESTPNNCAKDWIVEPIPDLLQSLIDRLMNFELTPMKPDSCIIDVFNEGDHSHPHSFPLWYGRPICLLSLNECDLVFGTEIAGERPGIYNGALSLTLAPGSLLVMQGNSTDVAKRAIPSVRKQRILITFLKSQPRRTFQGDGQRLHLQASQASNWAPLPSRQPNHIRSMHYTPVPMTGVLPPPPIRAQLPPSNGTPPLFVPPPVPTSVAFPVSMPFPTGSAGWPAAAPRHPLPRLPVPGTGVFLPPPGSGSSSPPVETKTATAEMSSTIKTTPQVETENDDVEVNGSILNSPKEHNGNVDGSGNVRVMTKEDQQQRVDLKVASEIAETA